MAVHELPDGLASRPLVPDDAQAVFELVAAQELADVGEVLIEAADLVADWGRPAFDLASSALGVTDGDRLVGYVEVNRHERGVAAVHPHSRGRGIGTWLAHRMQELARARGWRRVGVPVPEGSPGDRLLTGLGYRVRWTSWVLELPAGRSIAKRPLPEGYAVRAAREIEHRACWTVLEDAFLEWSDRAREPFDDFAVDVLRRPGFEPWQLRVVADPADAVVAAAVLHVNDESGYVDRLATRRDQRGRGLAQCLLADTFREARAHGTSRSELSTDSRTGALDLYEKVGMEVTSTWVSRAVEL
ncbi:GNAT family N-acetyltransferase [Nocardioides sp. W7]|uniref:GNAT family N-acetyltransferase n=1 Tax=Nocardioides sp. W7 TaxID=2931390 RepID=UPI001FD38304|nr:GNAT family N-acetyltransferase [Nocardioides sp. W7]